LKKLNVNVMTICPERKLMMNWNDYKNYVSTVDPESAKDLKEAEEIAEIITVLVKQSKDSGLSQ